MRTRDPGRVIALDLNPAQLACLELRVGRLPRADARGAAQELIGSPAINAPRGAMRAAVYRASRRPCARSGMRALAEIAAGIGSAGKMERYFEFFRTKLLPLIHSRARVHKILELAAQRSKRAILLETGLGTRGAGGCCFLHLLLTHAVSGLAWARDPSFFTYVEGSVADRIMARGRGMRSCSRTRTSTRISAG